MKKKLIAAFLVLTLLVTAIAVIGQAEETLPAGGAYMVTADGTQTVAEDPAAAWATGAYAYVKLYGKTDAFQQLQGDLWVDLNGNDLTVGGEGKLYVIDSANDAYDPDACGEITVTGDKVDVQAEATAPDTGNRYIAVAGDTITAHRFAAQLTTVSLRPSEAGLYYKARFNCDSVLAAKATKYGVVLSLNNMPGADFATEAGDINRATELTPGADFGNGTVANSGAVFGIMKEDLAANANAYRGELPIYANPYIQFGDLVVVGDNDNVNKDAQTEGFSGVEYSLHKVLNSIDKIYYTYPVATRGRVDQFKRDWNADGMKDWNFVDIAKEEVDGDAPLVLTGNTGYCQVCKKDVQWIPLYSQAAQVRPGNGEHYYLAEEVVTISCDSADGANGAIIVPSRGESACLHLNGNKLHATATSAIFSNSGTLNVMGDGIVQGNRNKAGNGDAVQLNNTGGCVVNLYGGTYMKTGTTRGVILGASNAGGTINIYKDVKLQTADNITGMRVGNGSEKLSKIGIYGADLTGVDMIFDGEFVNANKQAVLELVDAKLGTVEMLAGDNVIVKGETVVSDIIMAEDAKLTVEQMAPGSSVGTAVQGVFTNETPYAQQNLGYFIPANTYNRVMAKDGAMYIGKDFVSSAPIEEGYCPACEKPVTWEAMPEGRAGAVEGHYYLTKDMTHTATDSSYMSCPGSGKVGCVHLNGHNITSTGYPAIYSGSGTLNVMGEGIVTGYNRSDQPSGTAVQANSSAAATKINLYAGTYRAADNAGAHLYAIATRGAGGNINVYADAKIEANDNGSAILVRDTADADVGQIHLYGATVTGNVLLEGATYAETSSRLTIDNATINGTVQVNGLNTVVLNNAPKIQRLEVEKGSLLTIDKLKTGADITIDAEGVFSHPNENTADYTQYFKPVSGIAYMDTKDNALTYRFDYKRDLPTTLTNGGKALCPVCNAEVVWTEIKQTEDKTTRYTLEDGKHYYLSTSVEYTGSDTSGFICSPTSGGTSACLHLNGNDITSKNMYAIFGSGGVINVMGEGTVSGKWSSPAGAAVQINNKAATNAVNLYSGTYTRDYDCAKTTPVLSARYRGTFNIHEDVTVNGGTGAAIYMGNGNGRRSELNMTGCTVQGNITLETPGQEYPVSMTAEDVIVNGTVTLNAGTTVSLAGKTKLSNLTVAEGLLIDVAGLTNGAQINVSANGAFTKAIKALDAEHLAPCFTTADEGDWVIARNGAIVQEVKPTELPATEQEVAELEALFTGKTAYYGEMHNHAKTGGRSDGNNTLEQWVTHMEEKRIDFATIVDHRQSIHMYLDAWDDACFIGGSEPAVPTLSGTNMATQYSVHYNMIFADAADFEAHLKNIPEFKFTPAEDGKGGFYSYSNFSVSRMREMVQSVLDHGGFFVHVHPRFDNYLISDDPLDYWFGDKTGFEVATTEGGANTMAQKDCVEAYEYWNEMLRLNKRVFATLGDDNHRLSDLSSLTTIYSTEQTPQAFVDQARAGTMTAGPVGIRMSVGETITGGITSFENGRLVLAVGDIHEGFYSEAKRAGHTYGVELYDDAGILFATEIDPTQTTYFAVDTDATRMYYRAVVVDLTTGARVAVGNPIFNSAFYGE